MKPEHGRGLCFCGLYFRKLGFFRKMYRTTATGSRSAKWCLLGSVFAIQVEIMISTQFANFCGSVTQNPMVGDSVTSA